MNPNNFDDGDRYEVRVYCYCNFQLSVNRYLYVIDQLSGAEIITGDDLGLYYRTAFLDFYTPFMGRNAKYLGIGLTKLGTAAYKGEVPYAVLEPTFGASDSESLPTAICGVLRRSAYLTLPGRTLHGRVLLPFPGEEFNVNTSLPSTAFQELALLVAQNLSLPNSFNANGTTVDAVPYVNGNGTPLNQGANVALVGIGNRWTTLHKRGAYGRLNAEWPG